MLGNTAILLPVLLLQALSCATAFPASTEVEVEIVVLSDCDSGCNVTSTGGANNKSNAGSDCDPCNDCNRGDNNDDDTHDADNNGGDSNGDNGGSGDACLGSVITITDLIPGPTTTIIVPTMGIADQTCYITDDTATTDCTDATITVMGPTVTEPATTVTISEHPDVLTITETVMTATLTEHGLTKTKTITDTITTPPITVTKTVAEVSTTTIAYCSTDPGNPENPDGQVDTGDCTPPTISFYQDRDPNQAFEVNDTEIYGHGTGALISTLTSHICNQLRSPCNAPEDTVQYCLAVAALVDTSALQGQGSASYWNSFWV